MSDAKRNPAATLLRKTGFRATKPRLALFAFLSRSAYPLTRTEIAAKLKSRIDHVTVYRMLDSFKATGLVREVNLQDDRPRYELNSDDHHHIVCTKCRAVEDFAGCDIERIEKRALAQSRSFSKITGHTMDLYGICRECEK